MRTSKILGVVTLVLIVVLGLGSLSVRAVVPVLATIEINPDTLNLKSKGNYATAYIELPEGYNVADIDPASVKLGRGVLYENLLTNGGFEDGLTGWAQSSWGYGTHITTVKADGAIPDVMYYDRSGSWADGGGTGVYQDNLNILVSDYQELHIELDVKIISNWLQNSGWWSYVYGGAGEWPGHVVVTYEDANGVTYNWDFGFFPSDNAETYGRTNFQYVTRNTWCHYVSPNLAYITRTDTGPGNQPLDGPTPYKIVSVYVGGGGWDYSGMFDNVTLVGNSFTSGMSAVPGMSSIGDYDLDGIADLMLKFNRAELVTLVKAIDLEGEIGPDRLVTLTIVGTVAGNPSEGFDTIRVIAPGK